MIIILAVIAAIRIAGAGAIVARGVAIAVIGAALAMGVAMGVAMGAYLAGTAALGISSACKRDVIFKCFKIALMLYTVV
jgi:hypothetical protein